MSRDDGPGRAPQFGLVVDDRAAREEHHDRSRAHDEDECARRDALGAREHGFLAGEAADPPQQATGGNQQDCERREDRQLREPAVETVEARERHAEQRGERPEVLVRLAVDDERLEAQPFARDVPAAVEPGVGLHVVEAVETVRLEEVEPPDREHPDEHEPGRGAAQRARAVVTAHGVIGVPGPAVGAAHGRGL